jgi:hypothetical protein
MIIAEVQWGGLGAGVNRPARLREKIGDRVNVPGFASEIRAQLPRESCSTARDPQALVHQTIDGSKRRPAQAARADRTGAQPEGLGHIADAVPLA